MYLLLLGLAFLLLKYLGVTPVAGWSWWWVLSPFAATALWWWWADRSGHTRRRENAKLQRRRQRRIDANRRHLGLLPRDRRK